MARLDILRASLEKKKAEFDQKVSEHFETVKAANGQPLNDKRNGRATLNKWDRQNSALRKLKESIEKTEAAILLEEGRINEKTLELNNFPDPVRKLVASGVLKQWGKHPHILFVEGVERGRIVVEGGVVKARYHAQIPSQEQYSIFRDVFNGLLRELRDLPPPDEPAH